MKRCWKASLNSINRVFLYLRKFGRLSSNLILVPMILNPLLFSGWGDMWLKMCHFGSKSSISDGYWIGLGNSLHEGHTYTRREIFSELFGTVSWKSYGYTDDVNSSSLHHLIDKLKYFKSSRFLSLGGHSEQLQNHMQNI